MRWDCSAPVFRRLHSVKPIQKCSNISLWVTCILCACVAAAPSPAEACDGNFPPRAALSAVVVAGGTAEFTFDGSGSWDTDGTVVEYWFDFGDGFNTGWQSSASVVHIYAEAGTYSALLWVRDDCDGISGYDWETIQVTAPGGEWEALPGDLNCDGLVSFADVTPFATAVLDPGAYAVAYPDCDIRNGDINGDGETGFDDVNPFVELLEASLPQNQAPSVDAGPDRTATLPNGTVQLAGSVSDDGLPEDDTLSITWLRYSGPGYVSFANASDPQTAATFTVAGEYVLKLTADDGEFLASSMMTVVVYAEPVNAPPTANAGADRQIEVGQAVLFNGIGSNDTDGTLVAWEWNFGDGSQAVNGTGAPYSYESHTYTQAGTYYATLTVWDNDGAWDDDTAKVVVVEPEPDNLPPTANAGPNQTGEVDVAVQFSGSASDPDGVIASWRWQFGDGTSADGTGNSFAPASHTYSQAGTYYAKLTVWDDDGDWDDDTAIITIEEPVGGGTLDAVFEVQHYVVDEYGNGSWEQITNLSVPIELGLQVRFDASDSTGAYHYRFKSDGEVIGSGIGNPYAVYAYDSPGWKTIELTVYDETYMQTDVVSMQLQIAEGMRTLSVMPVPSRVFRPVKWALHGNDVWAISEDYTDIGVADISNPENLPRLQIVAQGVGGVSQLVAANGKLYLNNGGNGVKVYRADRNNFELLQHLDTSDLGGAWAIGVAAVDDVLYVCCTMPEQLFAFDMSNPAQPTLLKTIPLSGGVACMRQVGDDLLTILASSSRTVHLIDVRNSANPVKLASPLLVPSTFADRMEVCDNVLAVRTLDGIAIWKVEFGGSSGPWPGLSDTPHMLDTELGFPIGARNDRLFIPRNSTVLDKYNWQVASNMYLADMVNPDGAGMFGGFVFDPDGVTGPGEPVLMIAVEGFGFAAVSAGFPAVTP